MKYILDFYSFVKFFISFYFTSKFNYKISKNIDEKQYRNMQSEYLFKGELTQILQFENENNYSINRDWLNKLALHTQVTFKKSAINYEHGKILYASLSNYLKINKNNKKDFIIFETGTAKGFSSVCMSKALNDLGLNGKIYTTDIIPHDVKRNWNVIDDLECKKTRKQLLSYWFKEIKNIIFINGNINKIIKNLNIDYINFAFIDSLHTETQIIKEFTFISERQTIGDIIVLDDIDTDYDKNNEPNFKYLLNNFTNYEFQFIESFYPRCYAIAKKIY
tara:strand:+ start:292 stop:1122 length:831 start_codon:yes stop_codon:yes gene_type:complete